MNTKLKALKLILDEIDVPSKITAVEDRKKVQKAIYLGQEAGVDLGFHFGWYKMGPYSPELTKDYYDLAEELALNDNDFSCSELASAVKERLVVVKSIIKPPEGVNLPQEDWMELLASLCYLQKNNNSFEEAKTILHAEKRNLFDYVDIAESILKKNSMVNS
jgi:uncharacterized protein YwgA